MRPLVVEFLPEPIELSLLRAQAVSRRARGLGFERLVHALMAAVLLRFARLHHQVQLDFSRPGKPTDNSFVETFNGSLRDECLNVHWFESVRDAAASIEAWRRDYNESRPYMALGDMSPAEFARGLGARAQPSGSMGVGN